MDLQCGWVENTSAEKNTGTMQGGISALPAMVVFRKDHLYLRRMAQEAASMLDLAFDR